MSNGGDAVMNHEARCGKWSSEVNRTLKGWKRADPERKALAGSNNALYGLVRRWWCIGSSTRLLVALEYSRVLSSVYCE